MSDASKILENINKLQETLENNYLKTITIMFTDLKDSTKYFENHGDIKGRLFIERHNKMLFPIIQNHNGVIIKTIGDSIMAKFDSEYLAVRASIEMQKTLDEYNQTATEQIKIRIGIHTGKAIVENNDIFGDAVNVAARIEADTAPSRITISSTTLEQIKKFTDIKTRPLGMVKFKGKSDEIETYSVLWRTTELKDNLETVKKDMIITDSTKTTTNQTIETLKSNKIKISIKKRYLISGIVIFLLLVTSAIYFYKSHTQNNKNESSYYVKITSKDRKKIKRYAKSFIDKKVPKSKKWTNSLSGFVKMVYLYFDVDITNTNPKNINGTWKNTTELIYSFIQENGKIFQKGSPKVGDFIFFDNTYDKNKNDKFDDPLTTVAIIIDIDKEETIYFLYKVGNTIRIRNMNLKHPNKEDIKNKNTIKILNSKIRRLSQKDREKNTPDLSSQLFNSFGTLLDLPLKNGSLTKLEDFKTKKYLGNHQRKGLVEFALSFKDKSIPKSPLWSNSSSGFIKMVFLKFKVNIIKAENKKNENGKWYTMTELTYHFIKENGRLFKDNNYQIGDLIFFNNTFDKDSDGNNDDKLTSVGLIIDIDKNDTISFLINISNKVIVKYMNLKNKESQIDKGGKKEIINSVLRYFKKEKKYSYELFNSFGSIFK
jgi:class 3 adenylate cyclase